MTTTSKPAPRFCIRSTTRPVAMSHTHSPPWLPVATTRSPSGVTVTACRWLTGPVRTCTGEPSEVRHRCTRSPSVAAATSPPSGAKATASTSPS
ncbi:hypothetical protein WY02_06695 [Pseudonocardia sp. AL041005-10]|nr:hypothetical protein WY02_06695 [Pseudonocardia sp. AL041005-10]